jgi:peptide/nickel transport system substrate-binding protein
MNARWRCVVGGLLTALVMVSASPWIVGAPRTDVLIIAKDISDIRTPDPSKSYDIGGVFLQFPVYSRLVRQTAPNYWRVQPDLAQSWAVSPDARVYTFRLRDAVFHTGNPVTAEDVRFSLLRTKNIKGYGSFLADPIKNVEVVDTKTVRIELNEPDASFLAALAAGVFSIVDSRSIKAAGGVETVGADKEDKAEQWFYTRSAGSGPYRLVRYTRETEIVLERNERYFGAKPFFRQVIIRHVKDPSTQALMLQRGDADVALDLSVDQAEGLKGRQGIQLFEDYSGWTVYLGLNTSIAPWSNPKVRAAVKYAIDYEAIVSQIMRGHGRRIGSIMMPGMLGFTETQNRALLFPHNLEKARALMREAGVTRANVSLTWAAGGNYGALPLDRLAQKLRTDLERIGVDLQLEPVQTSIFLTQYRQGRPQTAIGFWFPDFMDPDNWSYFVTGFINRRLHWESAEGQRLVEEARRTASQQQRAALYAQYNQLLAAPDSPYVFLVQPTNLTATRDDLAGFHYHPLFFLEIERLRRR